MSRQSVRELKRSIRAGLRAGQGPELECARASAVALLERSIRFGHERLALVRLAEAVRVGAALTAEHWHYCAAVADRCPDTKVHAVLERAGNGAPNAPGRGS